MNYIRLFDTVVLNGRTYDVIGVGENECWRYVYTLWAAEDGIIRVRTLSEDYPLRVDQEGNLYRTVWEVWR